MNYEEQAAFLKSLNQPRRFLGIKKDLSLEPGLFGRQLSVKGLYLWGHVFSEESQLLSRLECDVILYNETDKQKVQAPEGYDVFRIRDLQEFIYVAAVRVHKQE